VAVVVGVVRLILEAEADNCLSEKGDLWQTCGDVGRSLGMSQDGEVVAEHV
jgi:hypothetical protein